MVQAFGMSARRMGPGWRNCRWLALFNSCSGSASVGTPVPAFTRLLPGTPFTLSPPNTPFTLDPVPCTPKGKAMNGRKQCEFFLIRYVPDAVKNEFVNIGVLLREAAGAGVPNAPVLRFTRDWARVRCVDPEADTAMLEALESELRTRLLEGEQAGAKPVLGMIEDSFSNLLQVTEPKGCLAESMAAEIESLMRVYVESRKRESPRQRSGRAKILAGMRSGFEKAGVWELMRKRIAASAYTRAGDPLRIDCGYRPNGVIRMFHAVSLEGETELAKVLAFSMAGLRAGVARVEGATLELTAVVEPLREVAGADAASGEADADDLARYRFAVEAMEAQAIRVMTTGDMARMAETARRELLGV
jgi:hypothetical protein